MSKAKVGKKPEDTVVIKRNVYNALVNCYKNYEELRSEFMSPIMKKDLDILNDVDFAELSKKKATSVNNIKDNILNNLKGRFKNLNLLPNAFSVLNFREIKQRVEDLVSKDDDLDLNENIYYWPIDKTEDGMYDFNDELDGTFNVEMPSGFAATLLKEDIGLTGNEFITFLKSLGDK